MEFDLASIKEELPGKRYFVQNGRICFGTIQLKNKRLTDIPLLTSTSKMACLSFSLPAGPPHEGGTCAAAALKEARSLCDGCYARSGLYSLFSNKLQRQIRLAYTRQAVNEKHFVKDLSTAIGHSAHENYFRIHDSGDFSGIGPEYFEAWKEIAKRHPKKLFWAPTRDWVFPGWLERFKTAPKNLIIRPSALDVAGLPPIIDGMAAGAGVSTPGLYACPVYLSDNVKSCDDAGCRTCWTSPEIPVSYHAHGKLVTLSKSRLVAAV